MSQVPTRLEKCEGWWNDFESIQFRIESLDNSEEQLEERDRFEDRYFEVVSRLKELLNLEASSSGVQEVRQRAPNTVVKLPVMEIPTFYGSYKEWLEFYDTFNTLVDSNESLTDIQKFYYLKNSLKGNAADVIHSLEVSATNYKEAWVLLKERFENKKLIALGHIESLYNFAPIVKESHVQLRKFLDEIRKDIRALKTLGLPIEHWDTLLIYFLEMKLDPYTKREWQRQGAIDKFATMEQLIRFLTHRCQLLETMNTQTKKGTGYAGNDTKTKSEKVHTTLKSFVASDNKSCPICKEAYHALHSCKTFLDLPIASKREEVGKANLCWNCLKYGHRVQKCTSRGCRHCGKKHNSLLHVEQPSSRAAGTSDSQGVQNISGVPQASASNLNSGKTEASFNGHSNSSTQNTQISEVLLSTAMVKIADQAGIMHECRALLDSGSQSSFMTKELRDKLQLSAKRINVSILGIGSGITKVTQVVNARVYSKCHEYSFSSSFLLVDKIADNIPSVSINSDALKIPNGLPLADASYGKAGKIDLLFGVTIFWDLLCADRIKLGADKPIMQNTKLGWVMSGAVASTRNNEKLMPSVQTCNLASTLSIQDQLERFWLLEEFPKEKLLSREEEECETIFSQTTKRDDKGHFIVTLPLRSGVQELGSSYDVALKRLHQLERKLARDDELRRNYHDFMREYTSLGHMRKIGSSPRDGDISNSELRALTGTQGQDMCYLPHHGVQKETSETTKLRVVFDASATTDNGISLNNKLMVGPKLQDDIFCVLVRFRKHLVVITADIAKMYRQIFIRKDQRDLQRILWRFSPDQAVDHYQLNTVTYGTASASYLAVRCLQQLALENVERFPEASQIILKDFYMDDLLSGSNTAEGARRLKHEISQVLGAGGFVLRKWKSNDKEVIEGEEDHGIEHYISDYDGISKTLGLCWNPESDTLHLEVKFENDDGLNERVTKRSILSLVSQLFDPLGLVGPLVVKTKMMLQCLWKLKMSWDDVVPPDIRNTWINFQEQMNNLGILQIPRHVMCAEPKDVQLHCFCDASQLAYGAAIYIRSTDQKGNHHVNLLCSKSRVAPLKVVSLPRLELCGALLLARLAKAVIEAINLDFSKVEFWCDSSIVLTWIAGEPVQWNIFVANRTSEIQRLTQGYKWTHVSSEDNPADVISRGMDCDKLKTCKIWWHGPDWLNEDEKVWPKPKYLKIETVPEQRIIRHSLMTNTLCDLFQRYSSFSKLQRVIAYCLRFCKNCSVNKAERNIGSLTVGELQNALTVIIKLAQMQEFGSEIRALEKSRIIPNSSKISSLNPFLDNEGVLRVGGRLVKSDLEYEQKYPIILPSKHRLTQLIIIHEHYKQLHAGPQALLAQIRLRYWPISGRRTVRGVLKNCVVCFRVRPREFQYIMGELPRNRVVPSRPFTNCGVDYAGPFEIKVSKTRGHVRIKAYLCVFVCFSTRAVHLELVGDLTTQSFLNCFKRFVARRGICKNIYSDNATNFVGANNELQELYKFLRNVKNQSEFSEYFSQQFITWHFIPPRSPHFGGLWESVVKAAKYHIKRVVGNQRLTFEELSTIVVQIESCLNSRPITPLSEDPDDLNVLTPGHFLIGTSLAALPQEDMKHHNPNRLQRYHLMTQLVQGFWNKWSKEYLTQLQQRNKWRSVTSSIQKGAMVIVKNENLPPLKWQLGRVVELHPGSDNTCRVVSVRTSSGIFKRAVSQLCVLPIEQTN